VLWPVGYAKWQALSRFGNPSRKTVLSNRFSNFLTYSLPVSPQLAAYNSDSVPKQILANRELCGARVRHAIGQSGQKGGTYLQKVAQATRERQFDIATPDLLIAKAKECFDLVK
jgi:hypothetical protein